MVEKQADKGRAAQQSAESASPQPILTIADHAYLNVSHNVSTALRLGRPSTVAPLLNAYTSRSYASGSLLKSKKKRGYQTHNFDLCWFIFLILSGLSPDNSLNSAKHRLTMGKQYGNERTLFDPVNEEICIDASPQILDKFFNSKMRWRDDIAWCQPKEIQTNIMLPKHSPILIRSSSPQPTGTNTSNRQPSEPSIVDYDVIDVYWRQDIEREKGVTSVQPFYYASDSSSDQGCSTSLQMNSDVSEQFERDLQLLTEKSLLTPLTREENCRYENLSKAHYADFYRTVPSAAAKRWPSTLSSSSTSGYSNNTEQFRSVSPAKSNISSFDEHEAANFFSNLAKQSMIEENRPSQAQASSQLHAYSNLTLCNDQSSVLNNVSLAQPANMSEVWSNNTLTSCTTTTGIRGSAIDSESPNQEDTDVDDEILHGIADQPLAISDSDANAIWSSMNTADLDDAIQLHEFYGMEMLGEFQQNNVDRACTDLPILENVLTYAERETSPSSGIGSQTSSSSPNHDLVSLENEEHSYRFYNKLAPRVDNQSMSFSIDASSIDSLERLQTSFQHKQTKSRDGRLAGQQNRIQRKRGRQSKDEQLAQDHNLPASAEEFAAMSHMELQKFLRDPKLTALQKSLIKKIRRRGRNKVAARKCRERRTYPESSYSRQNEFFIKDESQSDFDPSDLSLYGL